MRVPLKSGMPPPSPPRARTRAMARRVPARTPAGTMARPGRALVAAGAGATWSHAARCPPGFYQDESMVWPCSGVQESTRILLDQNSTPLVRMPSGLGSFRFHVLSSEHLPMLVVDEADRTFVYSETEGIVSMLRGSGFYKGMSVSCSGSGFQEPLNKTCSIGARTTAPLLLRLENPFGSSRDVLAMFEVSYSDIQPCPQVMHGCSLWDEVAERVAKEEVRAWSLWAKRTFGSAEGAWNGMADKYAFRPPTHGPLPDREVPFFAWPAVWREWQPHNRNGYLAFHYFDSDHDLRVSREEFAYAYVLAQETSDALPGGLRGTPSSIGPPSPSSSASPTTSESRSTTSSSASSSTSSLATSTSSPAVRSGVQDASTSAGEAGTTAHGGSPGAGGALAAQSSSVADAFGALAPWLAGVGAVVWLCCTLAVCVWCRRARGTQYQSLASKDHGPHSATFDRLLSSPEVRGAIEAHPASWRFHHSRHLGYQHRLDDGFRALFSRELLLVDGRREGGRAADPALRGYLSFLRSCLPSVPRGSAELVRTVAKSISTGFGGVRSHDLELRWRRRLDELRLEFPRDLPIGLLLASPQRSTRGAGLQRHRAVLFKYICDAMSVCDAALLWDAHRDTAISVALVDGRPVLVDLMDEPGAMQDATELHDVVQQLQDD